MRHARLIAASVTLLTAAPALHAQDSSRAGRERPTLSLSAGFDLMRADVAGRASGQERYFGAIGAQWRRRESGFGAGLELSGLYEPVTLRSQQFGGACAAGCLFGQAREYAGLLAGGVYEFRRASAVRPYVLTGLGLYMHRERVQSTLSCDDGVFTCSGPSGALRTYHRGWDYVVGHHAGLGVAARVGSVGLFAEQRFQTFANDRMGSYWPLTFGVRF